MLKVQAVSWISRVSGPVFRVAQGAIGNLPIYGMGSRAGKVLPMPVEKSFPGSGAEPRKSGVEAPTERATKLEAVACRF